MELLLAVVVGILVVLALKWKYNSRKQPPGPWGLPIVGYAPFLTKKPYVTFDKLAKKYGNVFKIHLGNRRTVVLNDFQTTKYAFMQDGFIGRPRELPFPFSKETLETGAFLGIPWKEQRRFCLHSLKDMGLGKSAMEGRIQEEIEELMSHFQKNVDKPFSVRELLATSMSNNISSLVFGKRFKLEDPIRQMLSRVVSDIVRGGAQAGWLTFFPWLKVTFEILGIGGADQVMKSCLELKEFSGKEVNEHEKDLNSDNPRDFIDAYLIEIKKRNDPSFCKKVLDDLVAIFFSAGSETVRTSVEWLFLEAAANPKHQRRIQGEIDEVVGSDRLPNWLDQKSMAFTEAFIMETMRWRTIVPLNLLRYTIQDTELNGYFIPKHTYVLSNHWGIHHDPGYWGPDADEFVPGRFFDEETKTVKKWDRYVPFSIGKRSCPGESLARIEIFLYFASILQKFNISLPAGKVADFEGELGATLQMKDQEIVLSLR